MTVNGKPVTEYYHRAVACHLICHDIPVPLDVELMQPGEGELPAGIRLLERVFAHYPRYFDALVADAAFLSGPFVNFCLDHGKHVILVLKDNNKALLEDARGLFRSIEPEVWSEGNKTVKFWDEEGFTSAETIKVPMRVIHTEERESKRRRVAGKWIIQDQEHSWYWATTIRKAMLPCRSVYRAAHGRWDIENDLFNDLVTHYHLNHCFKHHPRAIVNFILTLLIAFVLLKSFHLRNLKPQLRKYLTVVGLAAELYLGLAKPNLSAPCLPIARGMPP